MNSVLIIEDDDEILENLAEFLEQDGYQALKASNGKSALALLKKIVPLPSAILLDLMMPVMDAAQFRVEQEKDPCLATIPIILMSADYQIDFMRFKIGAPYFLKKPLDIEILSEMLKKIIPN